MSHPTEGVPRDGVGRTGSTTVHDSKPDPEALELAVISSVRGTVLEIGPGTGANFDDLPDDITWIGLEPDDDALRRLRSNARRFSRSTRVIEGVAEEIPLDDDSVDTVLSTLVLCSVEDQTRALAEIKRVLKPGGRFAFFEHIAGRRRSMTRLAQRVSTLGRRRRRGECDPLRDTLEVIRASFDAVEVTEYRTGGVPGLRMPHVAGWAGDGAARTP
jgi:SAM-dependent methyltransferase